MTHDTLYSIETAHGDTIALGLWPRISAVDAAQRHADRLGATLCVVPVCGARSGPLCRLQGPPITVEPRTR